MSNDDIKDRLKKSIAHIANLSPEEISDDASYKDDLKLDSLTILEITVDAEYQFKITIPDEELSAVRTVNDTVNLVQQYLSVGAVA